MCAFIVIFFASNLSHAKQLHYSKVTTEDGVKFQYGWIDADNHEQSIAFSLPHSAFNAAPIMHPNYSPRVAQRHVTVALLKEAQKVDPRDASITIKPQNDSINIGVNSLKNEMAEDVLAKLKGVQQDAFDSYLSEHYFTRFTSIFNQQAVKPDHRRYVEETTKALIPISQAFYEKVKLNADARAYFELLLSWVQSIPYSTLEDRITSNGSGFSPPLGLISQNLGDCDSKAVLTTSLVRSFLPNTKMVIIFLPDHALLGLALTALAGDETLEIEGETYVLYDPTGPALLPFGKISDSTRLFTSTGRYQVEHIE